MEQIFMEYKSEDGVLRIEGKPIPVEMIPSGLYQEITWKGQVYLLTYAEESGVNSKWEFTLKSDYLKSIPL